MTENSELRVHAPSTGARPQQSNRVAAASSGADSRQYLYGVQGLRTVAALMVAVYHIWFRRVSGGVDVFFVVAGYFAAGSLVRVARAPTSSESGRQLRDYLLRMFRRVVPSATVVVVATVLGSMVWLGASRWPNGVKDALASSLFVENLQLILTKTNYAEMGSAVSPFQQFWALAIQVQSYVTFTLLVFFVAWLARLTRCDTGRAMKLAIVAVFVISLSASIYLTATEQQAAYFSLAARFWEFLAGAILAFALPHVVLSGAVALVIGWIGLTVMVSFAAVGDFSHMLPGFLSLVPVCAASAVIASSSSRAEPGILKSKPLLWFADSSFAFYLWHWPLLVFYRAKIANDVSISGGVLILLLSIALAVATTKLIETPFRRWKLLREKPLVSVAATVLLLARTPGFCLLDDGSEGTTEARLGCSVALQGVRTIR